METYLLVNGSEVGFTGTPPPPPPAGFTTIFGFNHNNDTFYQSIAGRKWVFNNRAPCVREYGTTGLSNGDTFNVSTSVAPEKRVVYSFKEDSGGYSSAQ